MRSSNVLLAALALAGCLPTEPRPDDPVAPVDIRPPRPRAPVFEHPSRDSVWGFADLHAHAAGHLAFGGDDQGRGGFVYGDPSTTARDWRTIRLAEDETCDGETHLPASRDQVQRETQALVFGFIQSDAHRAHVPMIARSEDGDSSRFDAWPHGSDVLHQQMHVESIRRAYDGGLRLMFASAGENQTLRGISGFTIGPEPLVIDPAAEVESAIRQIRHIRELVQRNSDWMQIVTTPAQARAAIESDHLAIVISLELDWLSLEDTRRLYEGYDVRHVIPIHLADNPVGATAAFSDIFNAHSALYSRAFGAEEFAFQHVELAACVGMRLERPLFAAYTAGIVLLPQDLADEPYLALGYDTCPPPSRQLAWGHRNAGGLANVGYLRELMRLGMIIDVAHMSARSAADTILEASAHEYPLIASHTGITREDALAASDRALPVELARAIYDDGGIVGLGTRGVYAPERVLFHSQNQPLVRMRAGDSCRLYDRTPDFADRERALGTVEATRICVRLETPSPPALAVTVHRCDRQLERLPLRASTDRGCFPDEGTTLCTAPIESPGGIESAVLEVGPPELCEQEGPAVVDVTHVCAGEAGRSVMLVAPPQRDECSRPIDDGEDGWSFHVDHSAELFARRCDCRYTCSFEEPASADSRCNEPPVAPTEPDGRVEADEDFSVIRVRARAGGALENRLQGTSAFYRGTDVRVTLQFGGAVGAREVSLNQRGAWTGPNELEAYLVVRHVERLELTNVDVALVSDDARWLEFRIDEITVEVVPDPLYRWAEEYAELRTEIGGNGNANRIVFALGTDMNGLFPQFPTSGLETSPDGAPLRVGLRGSPDLVELHFGERGLATYGMLADVVFGLEDADRIAGRVDDRVTDSVLSSAEATIRAWEGIEEAARSMR